MLIVLPLFVGNAVRAAGWMTVFGNKGFLNVTLQALPLPLKPGRPRHPRVSSGTARAHHFDGIGMSVTS